MSEKLDQALTAERAAREAYRAAETIWRDAVRATAAARLEDSGLGGHLVERTITKGWGRNAKTVTQRFVVDRVTGSSVEGNLLKADGTIGVRPVRHYGDRSELRDLGPFNPTDAKGVMADRRVNPTGEQ